MAYYLHSGSSTGGCCAIASLQGFAYFGDPYHTESAFKGYLKDLREILPNYIENCRKNGESLIFVSLREDQAPTSEKILLEEGFVKVFEKPSYRDPGYSSNAIGIYVYLKQINPSIDRSKELTLKTPPSEWYEEEKA
jgi:hypothetical protein